VEVGFRRAEDACDYPDIDMIAPPGRKPYARCDGAPY